MKVEILAWDKFNPRKDVKTASWFRMENSFCTHPDFFDLTNDQKMIWIFLLCEASKKMRSTIKVNPGIMAAILRLETHEVRNTLCILATGDDPKLKIHDFENSKDNSTIESDRKKQSNMKNMSATNRTDITNETNERTNIPGELIALPDSDQINDPKPRIKKTGNQSEGSEVWQSYSEAYFQRYGVQPVRNAKTNTNCADLAKRLGKSEAMRVVRFYLTHNDSWFVKRSHMISDCLSSAESLHTQMLTDNRVTSTQAHKVDQGSEQAAIFERVTKRLLEKHGETT